MSGKYIVVFKDNVDQTQVDKFAKDVASNGGTVNQRYDTVLKGFSASIPDAYLQQLQSFTGSVIDYIEPDSMVTTQ
ncbi:protease propeptide/inhibitor [Epithele typhae]|uniref:protease propeptide/inhibitor n=1 Tax=Epithele typhae TaxID=378194 RepID=UPI0020076C6E|nr:protease propeptide/inhibitor [Epithele typhae]KAH9931147.1 protease propeptide/inhibitor [Epithele typhae]